MRHMMQKRADDQLIDAIGIYFHHATDGLGPELKPYKKPEWSDRVVWGEIHRDKAISGMKYFDQVLKSQPYVAGDQFSMADITVWAGLIFAGFAQIAIPDECTALVAWNAKISERPSVKNPA
jgi:glutathione S-transferase